MVLAITPRSPCALCEVCWHARCRSNDLIGQALQRCWDSGCEFDRQRSPLEGDVVGQEAAVSVGSLVVHGFLRVVHAPPNAVEAAAVKGPTILVVDSPTTLDSGGLGSYPHHR